MKRERIEVVEGSRRFAFGPPDADVRARDPGALAARLPPAAARQQRPGGDLHGRSLGRGRPRGAHPDRRAQHARDGSGPRALASGPARRPANRPHGAQQRPRRRPPQHRRPLRPRQRALLAVPRPHDDVLLRVLRVARRLARGGPEREARARLPRAGARRPRPPAGDRHRLGRDGRVRRRALRLPRDHHDDLARAARVRHRARRGRGPRGPGDGAAAGLPRPGGHLREARVDRDDRGGGLAVLPETTSAAARSCSSPTG